MQTLIGVLLDVSASMKENAFGQIEVEGCEWARSVFEVINNFIRYDVSLRNHIFAVGVGGSYGKDIFDVLKTIENLLNRQHVTIPSTYDGIVEEILALVEYNGAQNIRKWAPISVIKEALSDENAELLLRTLMSDNELLTEFVQTILPDVCKDAKNQFKQCVNNIFTTVVTFVVNATKADIVTVMEKAKLLPLKDAGFVLSVQDASKILNGCINADTLTQDRIAELMKIVEPYIYGKSPLYKALNEATKIFSKSEYCKYKKLLFVLSAGEPTDNDYTKSILDTLKDMDVVVVSCLVTSGKIQPQKIFSLENKEWNNGAKFLFKLSSTLSSQLLPRTIFIKRGWDIDITNNETKLFLQMNHPDNIKDICELARDVDCCQDALSDLMASVSLDMYINQTTREFQVPVQKDGTCYANASAAVLHMAMKRIIGRDYGYPTFKDLREQMIQNYGKDGANTQFVLEEETRNNRLHCKVVKVEDAMKAIVSKRPVVATFRLTDKEWEQFHYHFDPKNKTYRDIITKDVIKKVENRDNSAATVGHAVVLTSFDSKCLGFMNSWGENWGDNGFFRVENSKVLGFTFYDVFWFLKDLSEHEKANFKKEGSKIADKLFNQLNCLKNEKYTCPSCGRKSLVTSYTGSLSEQVSPCCQAVVNCKTPGHILALNIYLTSLAK